MSSHQPHSTVLLSISIFLLLTVSADSTAIHAQGDNYVLIFSDEFNQPNGNQPDSAKWNRHTRYAGMWSHWISDSEDVIYIKDGALVCRAIPNKSMPSDTARMLTGAINTKGKFEFCYGKVEVRMKTNTQKGNFPAVWIQKNRKQPNDPYAEIDIVESFGGRAAAEFTAHSQYTYTTPRHGQKNNFTEKTLNVKKWHIYGVEWTPDYILWSVDGKTVGLYQKSQEPKLLEKGQWTFDANSYLIINQSVGDGHHGGFVGSFKKVYETRIDWIRVYQKKD